MSEFPAFYDPDQVGTLSYPDMKAITEAAAEANLPPAAADAQRVHLLLIDMQVDFCHDNGSLYVPGAEEDIRRLITFLFRYAGHITDVTCTLDSHLPYQIFHPAWWVDEAGNHPKPLTIITAEEVREGRWRPLEMPEWSREYVARLEAESKKQLTIWPYHVMVGGMGNALDPQLWATVTWHALARKTQPVWMRKGLIPQSEYYSAIQPEIHVPGHPHGTPHTPLFDTVAESDAVLVAGEAKSHCVLETLEDIVARFEDEPEVLEKIYVLTDCMSSVVHPEVDFEAIAVEQFEAFAENGVNFVKSTDSLPFLEAQEEEATAAEGAADEAVSVFGLQRGAEWREETLGV